MRWVFKEGVSGLGLRRPHARDLHRLAALVGEGAISAEMQKRVREMIKVFLERAQAKLEGETGCEQEAVYAMSDSPKCLSYFTGAGTRPPLFLARAHS